MLGQAYLVWLVFEYDIPMGRSVMLDDKYRAEQSHDQAPWMIRNEEGRVVGHYNAAGSVTWGSLMNAADKEWLANLVMHKLARPLSA